MRATKEANVHDFINSLPDRYLTHVRQLSYLCVSVCWTHVRRVRSVERTYASVQLLFEFTTNHNLKHNPKHRLGRARCPYRAVKNNEFAWPVPSSGGQACCCSTNRPAPWTWSPKRVSLFAWWMRRLCEMATSWRIVVWNFLSFLLLLWSKKFTSYYYPFIYAWCHSGARGAGPGEHGPDRRHHRAPPLHDQACGVNRRDGG